MIKILLPISLLLFGFSALYGQACPLVIGQDSALFSIEFPRTPERFSDTLVSGKYVIYRSKASVSQTTDEGNTYYQSYTSYYPANYMHSDSSYASIEGFINSAVATLYADSNFIHLNTRYLFLNGFPGKEFRFRVNSSGGQLIYRVYLVESHLIEIAVNADSWFKETTSDFFDSFLIDEALVNSSDYGFSHALEPSYEINFPAEPELVENLIETEIGPIFMRIELLDRSRAGEEGTVYMAQEASYPLSFIVDSTNREVIYDNSVAGAMSSTNGKILWQKEITIAGNKGRQVMASMAGGSLFGTYQMVIVGNQLYVLGVMSGENKTNEAGERFLSSFKLKN